MASVMIGRAACPECGFSAAHVKQSEKCLYRYCPECGAQHYAKSERQRADLMSKTRTEKPATVASPTGSSKAAAPAAKPMPTATPTDTASPVAMAPVAPPVAPQKKATSLFAL